MLELIHTIPANFILLMLVASYVVIATLNDTLVAIGD